ncbi:hypothetical protein LQR31_15585, partial [Chromobacterium vaccinii]|uniref:hypothetical protein n=1 Tax=Chromobacterium vaccinii TaxID=1108595 RepID=UPI001E4BF98E
ARHAGPFSRPDHTHVAQMVFLAGRGQQARGERLLFSIQWLAGSRFSRLDGVFATTAGDAVDKCAAHGA